ncbi:MAG: adenylosuccinate lyase [Alphaproteobacteria bacterium]
MIPRYSRPEMANIWTEENKFKIFLEIEILALEAMANLGTIPADVPQAVRAKANFNIERINELEAELKHDVLAFLTNVAEYVGEPARFLHQGMTSSDVLDSCFAVQLTQSCDLLLAGMDRVLAALKSRAMEHRYTPCVGRSHGIHAEPTSFGLKLAGHYAAFARGKERLLQARKEIATCAISGPVGTFATVNPAIEAYVAEKMGLQPEPVSTQVIPRDRHAMFFAILGVIASSIENLATEVRHLQRSELGEAEEFFSKGQKGSSAMPHKRNPVLSENLTGLARLVRGAVTPALENVTLWHERDISHSSVERVLAPDTCVTLDFALHRLAGMMEKLVIYPEKMLKNLHHLGGVVFSQKILLALTQKGVSREDAYRAVQQAAMQSFQDTHMIGEGSFKHHLLQQPLVKQHLSNTEIELLFDAKAYQQHVDFIFARVFNLSNAQEAAA